MEKEEKILYSIMSILADEYNGIPGKEVFDSMIKLVANIAVNVTKNLIKESELNTQLETIDLISEISKRWISATENKEKTH